LSTSKSAVVIYNANKQREKQEWKLGENKIEEVDSTTYIDNFRELRGKNDIVAPMSTYVARGIFQEDLEVVRAVFFRISVIPVFYF
jgi:hypothetical protein